MHGKRIGFAGTPDFAALHLEALIRGGYRPQIVLTQPDRVAGRGQRTTASPVKMAAERHGLPVMQPSTLKDDAVQQQLREFRLDCLVVVAYGLLLPRAVLEMPSRGCVNVHASLLPRWRGAAPIQRAILAGDEQTGVSLMLMDEGLDTGPILAMARTPIEASDTAGTLHDRLADLGSQLLLEHLPALLRGEVTARRQPEQGVTYAAKLSKAEARMDWSKDAHQLAREVRAFNPWPVSFVATPKPLRVWRARSDDSHNPAEAPGTIVALGADGISVATGRGILHIEEVQPAGKRRMQASEWLAGAGRGLTPGTVWP
jgi:methionyl-tRNA formyltransferase